MTIGLYVLINNLPSGGTLQLYLDGMPVKVTDQVTENSYPTQQDGHYIGMDGVPATLCHTLALPNVIANWNQVHSTKITMREPMNEALEVMQFDGCHILKNSILLDSKLLVKQVRTEVKRIKNTL